MTSVSIVNALVLFPIAAALLVAWLRGAVKCAPTCRKGAPCAHCKGKRWRP